MEVIDTISMNGRFVVRIWITFDYKLSLILHIKHHGTKLLSKRSIDRTSNCLKKTSMTLS